MLITKTNFAPYVELSANLHDSKLKPKILEAQMFDLAGLMGANFYADMIQWVDDDGRVKDNAPEQYKDLINGKTYNIQQSGVTIPIVSTGIKPVVVYFAAARLIRSLDLHITPNAMMYKRNEYSDHADTKAIGMKATEYENQAIGYWRNQAVPFIDFSGKDLFPLWHSFSTCSNERIAGSRQRITGVKGKGYPNNYYYGR